MGNPQRLNDTEQLEILGLLEAVSTDPSAMRAARALAELMRHVNALGERIALELPDHHIARSLNRDRTLPPRGTAVALCWPLDQGAPGPGHPWGVGSLRSVPANAVGVVEASRDCERGLRRSSGAVLIQHFQCLGPDAADGSASRGANGTGSRHRDGVQTDRGHGLDYSSSWKPWCSDQDRRWRAGLGR